MAKEACNSYGNKYQMLPTNLNAHFITPNPPVSFNPISVSPSIDPTVYVSSFSTIIGDVTICENVFIAPNVSIRADEGTPFLINSGTNIQEGVIIHALAKGRVLHRGLEYSIYIGKNVSCTHASTIHGPCKVGDNVFVGFHATIYDAIVGRDCFISAYGFVTNGIVLAPNTFVPAGAIIDTQEKADALGPVSEKDRQFAAEVIRINQQFPRAYSRFFGNSQEPMESDSTKR